MRRWNYKKSSYIICKLSYTCFCSHVDDAVKINSLNVLSSFIISLSTSAVTGSPFISLHCQAMWCVIYLSYLLKKPVICKETTRYA